MGNKFSLDQCKPFQWQEQFQIIDSNLHDNFLSVRSLTTRDQYLGKEVISVSETQTKNIQSLISKKINQKSEKVSKLVWAHRIKDLSYCSYQTKFYLAFEKYALNLKEEKIRRQFNGEIFSEAEVEEIMTSIIQGLIYLRGIGQPHQRICLQNIFLRDDRTVMLSDPWLFSKQYPSIYTFHINGFIYPSPQKILYENDMIDGYDPYLSDYYSLGVLALELIHQEQMDIIYEKGFRRILEDTINKLVSKVQNRNLQMKLKIILSYDPVPRQMIQKMENVKVGGENRIIKSSQVKEITGIVDYDDKRKQRFLVRRESQLKIEGSRIERSRESKDLQLVYQNNLQKSSLTPQHLSQYNSVVPSVPQTSIIQLQRPKIVFNHHIISQQSPQGVVPQSQFRPQIRQISFQQLQQNKIKPEAPNFRNNVDYQQNIQRKPLQSNSKSAEKCELNHSEAIPKSAISIEEEINRIIKTLKGQQDFHIPMAASPGPSHQSEIQIQDFIPIPRHHSQQQKADKINLSQDYLSVSQSYNVKTSFSDKNTPQKVQNNDISGKSEKQRSIRQLKHLTSMGQVFKETQSINESFDDRSQNSVVIGHRFSSKDSSTFGNFRYQTSVDSKVAMGEREQKQLLTIEERSNSQVEQLPRKSTIEEDEVKTEESRTQNLRPEQFQTPEHRPMQKRYNSTIKEVSEDQPSIESVENDYEEKVLQYAVGTKYIGQTKNGKRWGRGLYYYIDGSYYEGQWKDNKMHGRGSLYYSNGSLAYEGGWYMDTFHGKGRVYNDCPLTLKNNKQFDYKHLTSELIDDYWYIYEGDFFFEQKHGQGKLKLSNGQAYTGEWNQDRIHGRGKFYRLNGEVIQGKWSNGELIEEYV